MGSRLVGILLCSCCVTGGCDGLSEAGIDASEILAVETAPGDPDGSFDEGSLRDPCADLPDLTGRVYRVTDFVATEPTDGINPTWKKWADAYDLVMLFRILEHDRVGGRVEAVMACGGAEVAVGGDGEVAPVRLFYALEPIPVHFSLDGCGLTIEEPLDIHLFTPWVSAEIPIRDVTGVGTLSEDGAEIEQLELSGFLGEATAAAICIDVAGLGVVNLHWFFNLAGICADADTDGDMAMDAYNFLGWVRAVDATPLFDAEQVVIGSQVPECMVHEEPCVTAPEE